MVPYLILLFKYFICESNNLKKRGPKAATGGGSEIPNQKTFLTRMTMYECAFETLGHSWSNDESHVQNGSILGIFEHFEKKVYAILSHIAQKFLLESRAISVWFWVLAQKPSILQGWLAARCCLQVRLEDTRLGFITILDRTCCGAVLYHDQG